jgi:hypothetical protein
VTKDAVRSTVKRLAWELRTLAGRSPLLCRWLLHRSGEVATAETEICIEGFPRSGNTFTVIAFQQAQARTVSIAHHVHAPGSVIGAARLRKPALILLREPEEAAVSMVIRYPHLSLGQALRGYRRFYAPLVPYRDRVVVGRFEDVTADLGGLIRQVNQRFGTSFREFEPTEVNVSRAMEELDRWDLNTFGDSDRLELGRARPSDRREQVKRRLREQYRHPRLAKSRERAERLHQWFARHEGRAGKGY